MFFPGFLSRMKQRHGDSRFAVSAFNSVAFEQITGTAGQSPVVFAVCAILQSVVIGLIWGRSGPVENFQNPPKNGDSFVSERQRGS